MEKKFEELTKESVCELLKSLTSEQELIIDDNGIKIIPRGQYES